MFLTGKHLFQLIFNDMAGELRAIYIKFVKLNRGKPTLIKTPLTISK